MGFLKGSQMLQQNCEHNKLYIFKNTAIDHFSQSTSTEKPWLFYGIHLLIKKKLIQRIIYVNKDDRQKTEKL